MGSVAVGYLVSIVLLLSAFGVIHACQRYSAKEILVYIAIGFVASNIYENLSILTGFPFGRYHYSDALGIKLFLVPIVIAPAYLSAGYLAWNLISGTSWSLRKSAAASGCSFSSLCCQFPDGHVGSDHGPDILD